MYKLRKASKRDSAGISKLTQKFSTTLSRSPKEILRLAGNFYVVENQNGKMIGCCGFKVWDNDAEIISLIVNKPYQGRGVAKKLLKGIIGQLKKTKNVKYIFALATSDVAQRIFIPAGFIPAGIQMFNQKVAKDCKRCRKNKLNSKNQYLCDEIALLYNQ